jgi:hypothetical protein
LGQPPSDSIVETIDLIFEHHYFRTKLSELIPKLAGSSPAALHEPLCFNPCDTLAEEVSEVIGLAVGTHLRKALTSEFEGFEKEIDGIKQELFRMAK